jgi:hypothetical protein
MIVMKIELQTVRELRASELDHVSGGGIYLGNGNGFIQPKPPHPAPAPKPHH